MMPPAKIFLLLIFSWAVFPRPLQAREEPPTSPSWPRCVPARPGSRILFLGNSYTFFNRMPAMVKAMADTKGLRPDVHMHAAPAASLQSHWNDRRARSNMEGTAWDFVILQDQSATPVRAPERTMEFGEKWCSLVRAAKGTPILMLTWGKRGASGTPDPQEQKALLETYLKLARREKAALAPVGIAWENCLKRHPGIQLYQPDGRHPTEEGSYLTACVIYFTLFGKSPLGLPGRLSLKGTRLSNLPADRARILQTVARDTCRQLFSATAGTRPATAGLQAAALSPHSAKSTRKTGTGPLPWQRTYILL